MEAIGEKIGREPEFTDTSFDTIFVQLAQGKFEAVASATTITENAKKLSTSPNRTTSGTGDPGQRTGERSTRLELKGATVGAQKGTTGEEFVEEKAEAGELRTYPQGPDAVNAVKSGVVEAVVMDIPVAENAVKSTTGIEISSPIPTEEEYGIAVGKNDEALLEEMNEGLAEIKEDGTYAEIYEKYFHRAPSKEILEVRAAKGRSEGAPRQQE